MATKLREYFKTIRCTKDERDALEDNIRKARHPSDSMGNFETNIEVLLRVLREHNKDYAK